MQCETHPWEEFLKARARAIDWMYADATAPTHRNDAEIARALSMDETQVALIRTRNRSTNGGW